MSKPVYILAGGGSGGHLYPGISIAQYLTDKLPHAEVIFLCTERDIDEKILSQYSWHRIPQPIKPVPRNLLKLPDFLLGWQKSCNIAAELYRKHQGRVVVCGLGGFASGPALKTANKMNVPVAMLNPDAVPGKANKFCQKYVSQIFVQWQETVDEFGKYANKCLVTGCPVRAGFHREVGLLSPEKLYTRELLVFGGSLGGHNVNTAVTKCIGYIDSRNPSLLEGWKIVHITGERDFEFVQQQYSQLPYDYEVLSYCDDMDEQLKKASMVVCRAGASTLAELTSIGVPSILLPYPYHKDQHQLKNAEILANHGAAAIVEDTTDDVKTAALLYQALCDNLDKESCYKLAISAKNMARSNAAEMVASELAVMM